MSLGARCPECGGARFRHHSAAHTLTCLECGTEFPESELVEH